MTFLVSMFSDPLEMLSINFNVKLDKQDGLHTSLTRDYPEYREQFRIISRM